MKSLIIIALTLGSLTASASSNDCFKKVVGSAKTSGTFQENVKALNEGIKLCRKTAKKEKLAEQIKKLQAKLSEG